MQRIVIVGSGGSGKTTLAQELSAKLHIPHVELDSLHWLPNWTPAPMDEFRQKADIATLGNDWVLDGNYSKVRDIVWKRADTLIWLTYPITTVVYRLTKRTLRRVVFRQELWGTNTERWQNAFFSQDSLYVWLWKTHWRRLDEYPQLFQQPEFAHLQVIRLRSPRETQTWLNALKPES